MNPVSANFRTLCFSLGLLSASAAYAANEHANATDHPPPWAEGQGQIRRQQAQLEGKVHRLEAALRVRGYDVARGATKLFNIPDCPDMIAVIGSCLGNNPTSPYIVPSVPLWPDEYVDEGLRGLIGPLPNNTWSTHRMDKREAVLVFGLLAPPAKYFGIQTYIFSRPGALNPNDPIYQATQSESFMHNILFMTLPRNPERVMVFASMGNSNNNVTVASQAGSAFNQQGAFVISTDAALTREMTDALVAARVTERNRVFAEPVSSSLARLGVGADADDFMTLIRYAQPIDKDDGDAWRQQRPIAVLRVRDRDANATEPYPTPVYDTKTARSELGMADSLAALVSAIKQQWGQPAAGTTPFVSLQLWVDLIGQHCLLRPMNCLGDTQDADYQIGRTVVPDENTVIAVAGTLGTATGNATYSSLSVNWLTVLEGVANVPDDVLQGSASGFGRVVADADKFYVQYFARNCTGISHCLTITEDMVPKGDPIKVIQRNYVVPGTARGADPTQVLNPVTIVLDRSTLASR
jgi:hypothetical protein